MGEFVQQAQHVARHSGPSGAPHLLCTSKILLSTIILLAIHIYQPHSEFYTSYTLQCRLYIERACYPTTECLAVAIHSNHLKAAILSQLLLNIYYIPIAQCTEATHYCIEPQSLKGAQRVCHSLGPCCCGTFKIAELSQFHLIF